MTDRNYITEDEAFLKYCPKIEEDCLGSDCMMWVWQDPQVVWAEESPGEGWERGEIDDVIFNIGGTEPKPPKYEWKKEREVLRGRCGLRKY
jgi:hypothetical protein